MSKIHNILRVTESSDAGNYHGQIQGQWPLIVPILTHLYPQKQQNLRWKVGH